MIARALQGCLKNPQSLCSTPLLVQPVSAYMQQMRVFVRVGRAPGQSYRFCISTAMSKRQTPERCPLLLIQAGQQMQQALNNLPHAKRWSDAKNAEPEG